MTTLNVTVVDAWTRSAYHLVENCGYNGTIVYGDGFLGVDAWKGVFPEDEFPNLMLDVHEYTIFDPSLISMPHAGKVNYVCINWKDDLIRSSNPATGHGLTFVGEWSQADTDCTPMLNNVGVGARWDGTFNPGPGGADPVLTPHCPTMDSQCSCALPSSASVGNYSAEYKTFCLILPKHRWRCMKLLQRDLCTGLGILKHITQPSGHTRREERLALFPNLHIRERITALKALPIMIFWDCLSFIRLFLQ